MRKTLAAGIAWILVFMLLFCSCSLDGIFRRDRPGQDGTDGTPTPPSSAPGASVQTYTEYDSFGFAVAELVKEHPAANWSAAAAAEDRFFAARLIVQASGPVDFSPFRPTACIAGPDHLYILQFAGSSDADSAFRTIANMPEVIYVEPDGYLGTGSGELSAAEFKSWGVQAIGADALADYVGGVTGDGITVSVVDTGVSSHPFLDGRILSGGYDFVDNDATPTDLNSHGTHVAGTVVDCTPGLKVCILPVRVLNENGHGAFSTVGAGIRYAADHGAKVINLSLGGGHSSYVDAAVQYAIGKGVCVVVAAGNDFGSTEDACPAHIRGAITVGAVDSNLNKAPFSNVGPSLDLVCPGVGIVSCVPGGRYESFDGTSMAAPHCSASVAMLRLLYPALSPGELEKLLCSHTRDLGPVGRDDAYGAGLPDLASFVPFSEVFPEEILLSASSLRMAEGSRETLYAAILPYETSYRSVQWNSDNSAVAAVTGDGVVLAMSPGTARISATTVNGLTAYCEITVESAGAGWLSVASEPYKMSYYLGEDLDPSGLELLVTYPDGSTETVSGGYSCSPSSFDSTGPQTVTVYYNDLSTDFTVWVDAPAVVLSSYSDSRRMNCWDSYWNLDLKVPLWKLPLPDVTTYPEGGSVRWSILSGQAYLADDYIAAQQPGTVVARAEYSYRGYSCTADYEVTLSMYKTTTDINYLQSRPTLQSEILAYVPNGATVEITEVAWDASIQASDGIYYLYGKTVYNGIDGWIVIS